VLRFPLPGETIVGDDFLTSPGGKGANQAVAARRLGADVRMIGKVGNDAYGARLRQNLQAEGIEVQSVEMIEGEPSGVAVIVVDRSGQNSIVVASGANRRLSPADLVVNGDSFRWADVVLFQLESPLETVCQGIRLAHAGDSLVILNPAPAQSLPPDIWPLVDFLVLNESEAALLTGGLGDRLGVEQAAEEFLQRGVRQVIISLGERGAYFASAKERFTQPAFPVISVDSTAAGDAFVSALAVAFASGWAVQRSLPFAAASGALTVTRMGAQSSLPTRQEVEDFLLQMTGAQHG
jgi:ribokinase